MTKKEPNSLGRSIDTSRDAENVEDGNFGESEEQAPIIYVELKRPFPPEALTEPALAEFAGFKNLFARGLVRQEYSFGEATQKLVSRSRFLTLHFQPGTNVVDIAQELNEHPEVIHAIEARKLTPPRFANHNPLEDPLVGTDTGGTVTTDPHTLLQNQWYLFRCRVHRGWALKVSGKGTIVADIDWGFRTSHDDFKDRIAVQRNTMNGSSSVNGGWGVDHGTAVLGILGAANNGLGMVGIAFDSELWAVQAGERPLGELDPGPWLKAFEFVIGESRPKRKVILLEVQTENDENIEVIPPIREAIREAIANGIVVCVAAGNGGRDAGLDAKGNPFPTSGPIHVGATNYGLTDNPIAPTSNHGVRVSIYAPGDESCDLTCGNDANDSYRNGFGRTSGAAPKVAGTIALMLEANPKLCHFEIKDILKDTGTIVTGDTSQVRGTFLNAEAAVEEALRRAKI